jgi:hypothetical protein
MNAFPFFRILICIVAERIVSVRKDHRTGLNARKGDVGGKPMDGCGTFTDLFISTACPNYTEVAVRV